MKECIRKSLYFYVKFMALEDCNWCLNFHRFYLLKFLSCARLLRSYVFWFFKHTFDMFLKIITLKMMVWLCLGLEVVCCLFKCTKSLCPPIVCLLIVSFLLKFKYLWKYLAVSYIWVILGLWKNGHHNNFLLVGCLSCQH